MNEILSGKNILLITSLVMNLVLLVVLVKYLQKFNNYKIQQNRNRRPKLKNDIRLADNDEKMLMNLKQLEKKTVEEEVPFEIVKNEKEDSIEIVEEKGFIQKSKEVLKSEEEKKEIFVPKVYCFDEFNDGIFIKNAREESKRCVYKITTTEGSKPDNLELIINDKIMITYVRNENIYFPDFICNINYLKGGALDKIVDIKPGKADLVEGEWKVIEKITISIL